MQGIVGIEESLSYFRRGDVPFLIVLLLRVVDGSGQAVDVRTKFVIQTVIHQLVIFTLKKLKEQFIGKKPISLPGTFEDILKGCLVVISHQLVLGDCRIVAIGEVFVPQRPPLELFTGIKRSLHYKIAV